MCRSKLWFVLGVVVLCGCGDSATVPENGSSAEPTRTVTTKLILQHPVHHLGGLAREPMVVEHPDGTLFVSGYGSQVRGVDPKYPPKLWKSSDGGASWTSVDVGTTADGARGNSDVDLTIGPDGTLYFMSMGFNRTTKEGTHIAIGVSHDVGASWTWTSLSEDRLDDRPWVEVAPDGTAHAVWNDGDGVSHTISVDGGRTWSEHEKVHPLGGSSHLAVGPNGEVAVRITPLSASGNRYDEGVELIAVSTNGGDTWVTRKAPGTRDWDPTWSDPTKVARWVEPVAWDGDGVLYHLWSEGDALVLGRSRDHGATWMRWIVANDGRVAYFPYLIARGAGELAASWFSGRGDGLVVNVALIRAPPSDDGDPTVVRAESFQPDSWLETDDSRSLDSAGEYVPVIFLSGGGLGVVTPVQDKQNDRFGFTWWKVEAC